MTVQEVYDEVANFPDDVDITEIRKALASFVKEEHVEVDSDLIVQLTALRYLAENQ